MLKYSKTEKNNEKTICVLSVTSQTLFTALNNFSTISEAALWQLEAFDVFKYVG